MNEIIEVSQERIGTVTVQTVSAKELHAFLGVGRDFSNWIKGRILKYGFIENRDYIVFAKPGENPYRQPGQFLRPRLKRQSSSMSTK